MSSTCNTNILIKIPVRSTELHAAKLSQDAGVGICHHSNVGDSYLVGKVLTESGAKVQFDGNPRNFLAFKQGMDRVMSLYGSKFGLIYDILQSRCVGKASEAIKFCDRIQDPECAANTALERLKIFFWEETSIIEAHIANITRNEMMRWNTDSYQSFLNELEDIKILLGNSPHHVTINSPGVMKGIISRLPKRTRHELAKMLCDSNELLPDFEALRKFIEKQLKLVSHPVMRINPKGTESKAKDELTWKTDFHKTIGRKESHAVKSYSQNVTTYKSFRCPIVGCLQKDSHALWGCIKYAELSQRDKWAIAANGNCCYKCLNHGHRQEKCKSRYCCRKCKSSHHHYLLCPDNEQTGQDTTNVNEEICVKSHNVIFQEDKKILPIIPVTAINADTYKKVIVNCLLDSGCDTTMATKRFCPVDRIEIQVSHQSKVGYIQC